MNRRQFLKTLGLALAATQVPLPKAKAFHSCRINPAWVNAPYEIRLFFADESFGGQKLPPPHRITPILFRRGSLDDLMKSLVHRVTPIIFRRADAMDKYLTDKQLYPTRLDADKQLYPTRLDADKNVVSPVIEI